MLLVAAAVALPMEQGERPALTAASSSSDGRTRAEQLIKEGKELWEGALKAGVADAAREYAVLSGLQAPDASASALGSVSLVVNQTHHPCSHLVPLDTNFHTSQNTNRHKYNSSKFGPRAPQPGFAEFLGPHQTAEWFGVSPTMGGLSFHKKSENGEDAVRISSITLDKAMYVDSFDVTGLPMPNGAFYPQMSDPKGYPRPLYLAPHTGILKVTITDDSGGWSLHKIDLKGTTWENGQEGTWRRLNVGKKVKEIKLTGDSESTWAVRNFCGAYHPGGTTTFAPKVAKPKPSPKPKASSRSHLALASPAPVPVIKEKAKQTQKNAVSKQTDGAVQDDGSRRHRNEPCKGKACGASAAHHLETHMDENKTVAHEAQQAQAAFKSAEAELQSTETDLQNKHSALKEAKQHLKSKRTELTILKIPTKLEQAKAALKAENNKLNTNRAELVGELQKVGAKERELEATLRRHDKKHQREHR